jgi:hypothetical protein
MTRAFAFVLAVVGCLLAWAYLALPSSPKAASILSSLALGIMLAFAILDQLGRRVVEPPRVVRDPRVIEAQAHESFLAAVGLSPEDVR